MADQSNIHPHPTVYPLPKIERHDQLPSGSEYIDELRKGKEKNNPNYMFIKQGKNLSILITYVTEISGQEKYICRQKDFP